VTSVEVKTALDAAPEFVAAAVAHLASCLGEDDPAVAQGRRAMAAIDSIPDGAVLVTEESLTAALHRAFPSRRNTESGAALSAATILAALRTRR
jgi:hypothetical protein